MCENAIYIYILISMSFPDDELFRRIIRIFSSDDFYEMQHLIMLERSGIHVGLSML